MINVKEQTEAFCILRDLSFPSGKDISSIGSRAIKRFRFIYVQKSGLRGHIEGTGLMRLKEGNQVVIVNGYPDDFSDELDWVIETFFNEKEIKRVSEEQKVKELAEKAAKPKRPRIPANRPIYNRR